MRGTFLAAALCAGHLVLFGVDGALAQDEVPLTSAEELASCTINALTPEETDILATWFVMGLSSYPAMADAFAVAPASRDATNEAAAQIFAAIWSDRCAEIRQIAYDEGGDEALNTSQTYLNIHLTTTMMTSQEVYDSLLGINEYIK